MEWHRDMEGNRERRWTPTRAKAQDTRASPNSLETHLVRKWEDIGHIRVLRPWMDEWMDGWILPVLLCNLGLHCLIFNLPNFILAHMTYNSCFIRPASLCLAYTIHIHAEPHKSNYRHFPITKTIFYPTLLYHTAVPHHALLQPTKPHSTPHSVISYQ